MNFKLMHSVGFLRFTECPDPRTVFDFTNAQDPTDERNYPPSGERIGKEFTYKCQPDFALFTSIRSGPYQLIVSESQRYRCPFSTSSNYGNSIERYGEPSCKQE